jgi:hypothetical protein
MPPAPECDSCKKRKDLVFSAESTLLNQLDAVPIGVFYKAQT